MAEGTSGSSNTAIVAIVVLVLVLIVGFLFYNGTFSGGAVDDGPEVELNVGGDDGGE